MRATSLACLLVFVSSVPAAERGFTGYARDLDTGALLYVETHAIHAADTADEWREVSYRHDPAAEPFARKTLRYGADRQRPSFEFLDQRSGFAESVTRGSDGFRVWSRSGRASQASIVIVPLAAVAVVDAGFDEFVRTRWDDLQRGRSLSAPFLVPSRRGPVNFRVRKEPASRFEGAAVSVIRISLAGPLGWFLPDIDVTYRDQDRRLLRYRGLTNIRDASGELLSAQIDFPDPGVTATAR